MLKHRTISRAITVAKETTQDAVSLLAEAVLGSPVRARAGCTGGGYICFGPFYDNCTSCGWEKKKRGYCWCYPNSEMGCCEWVDCVYC